MIAGNRVACDVQCAYLDSNINQREMELIIALYGVSGCGKSSTLRATWESLRDQGLIDNEEVLANNFDFQVIVTVNGSRVGIVSQGDPGTGLENRLRQMARVGCRVVFCSCRTRGTTIHEVERVADEKDSRIIWTSPYQDFVDDQTIKDNLNALKGRHLTEVLTDFLEA